MKQVLVARIRNELKTEMRLWLEMLGTEVVLSPGHAVDLFGEGDQLLPVTIDYVEGGLQIHPYKEADPDWHVRFNGKLIRVDRPTNLADHEYVQRVLASGRLTDSLSAPPDSASLPSSPG